MNRLSEAAVAGERALRLLSPFFLLTPSAYARLMTAICRDYLNDMTH